MTHTLNMPARIFDGTGEPLDGGPPLDGLDLRCWPTCRVFGSDRDNWDGAVDLIVITGEGAALSPDALAHLVAASDRGLIFALHSRDDPTLREAVSAWRGGAHV
jgi:hypothetical protein